MSSVSSEITKISQNGKTNRDPSTLNSDRPIRPRNIPRAVWELARLQTKEGWLAVEPAVWGACVTAGTLDISLDLPTFCRSMFGIWASCTVAHCFICTINDILDMDLDKDVERTKRRPLPSGMISYREAVAVFLAWIPVILAVTYYTLGAVAIITFAPIWMLGVIYPLMKRVMPFPHLVIGVIHGAFVFSGWVSVADSLDGWERGIPLFAAVVVWVVYFDVFYAAQDYQDDEKIGVKSLVVVLGEDTWILVTVLGLLQIVLFVLTAFMARMSMFFWVFGVGVWALNIPWHLRSLDLRDRTSGGKIFRANIMLGLYMTVVALLEMLTTRVYMRLSLDTVHWWWERAELPRGI